MSGWHRLEKVRRHPSVNLSAFWQHASGALIYQGRPNPAKPGDFVYRLQQPNGSFENFSMLRSAKAAQEQIAKEPERTPSERLSELRFQIASLACDNTSAGRMFGRIRAEKALDGVVADFEVLLRLIASLKRGSCWCEAGIGKPMYGSTHSVACQSIRAIGVYEMLDKLEPKP